MIPCWVIVRPDIPVGSSGVPAKSDDEVTRVVPVGSESSRALVVLEVGQVAIVVLDIANGLTLIQLVLLYRFRRNRRGHGGAQEGEESGRQLHVVVMIDDCDGMLRMGDVAVRASFAPLYRVIMAGRDDAHGSTRRYSG